MNNEIKVLRALAAGYDEAAEDLVGKSEQMRALALVHASAHWFAAEALKQEQDRLEAQLRP